MYNYSSPMYDIKHTVIKVVYLYFRKYVYSMYNVLYGSTSVQPFKLRQFTLIQGLKGVVL